MYVIHKYIPQIGAKIVLNLRPSGKIALVAFCSNSFVVASQPSSSFNFIKQFQRSCVNVSHKNTENKQ